VLAGELAQEVFMEVKPFNQEMIQSFLSSNGIDVKADDDGDYSFSFSADDKTGCALRFLLMVSGENKDVYDVRVYADREIAHQDWSRAIMACNEWNDAKRWPKTYFHAANPDSDTVGRVVCEGDIDLEAGIHQELFDDFTLTIITRSQAFWEWMHTEKGF
jgi:hypothetical protein